MNGLGLILWQSDRCFQIRVFGLHGGSLYDDDLWLLFSFMHLQRLGWKNGSIRYIRQRNFTIGDGAADATTLHSSYMDDIITSLLFRCGCSTAIYGERRIRHEKR